ncbi:ATP-grasp domain-containing protein [Sphingomonas sp. RIT328]|uniref:ATP-grasp domain-containing protein n=1 Tax=Sphingomonas sp. RIT328 TaxID=1470591 RepID=UPI0004506225|nr:alpha-L-glutamate ligase [Sphingomonas sp. RIT328]EZP55848.1 Ribosomal protein S6 modification protein [Sphingomonas sp. RIT328]
MPDLAILYEHPQWFAPLFAALDARGVNYTAIHADGFAFDPAAAAPPAPLVFNRIAMSSFLRAPEHPIFHAAAALAQWQARGARVLNGSDALAIDSSKARQLSLIAGLGLAIPATRVVHRAADLPAAAAALRFPIVVKANIGGSGAGIVRYDDAAALAAAVADGSVPDSIDRVLLAQEYAPARGDRIIRIETLGGRFLYAIEVDGGGSFDLCPADACALPGKPTITMTRVDPDPSLIAAAEAIVAAAGIDVGGVEVLIDDRDGVARFYDINALSNFVARPLEVLGWDPHARLVDWLTAMLAETRR